MCVASVVPLPGSARPIASARQFIELAVNIPVHEPHVGQAFSSIRAARRRRRLSSAEAIIGSIRSSLRPGVLPASIGPPETKTVGMLSRKAASSMPGVILSQLEMQIRASAQWALTMYSTASAMSSRLGRE